MEQLYKSVQTHLMWRADSVEEGRYWKQQHATTAFVN